MDSPTNGPRAATEAVEEMPRWQNTMYEAPGMNCQNFNNGNYNDWAKRRPLRNKAHHHSKRGQHQGGWSYERGPAPVSPQWQPQPPPPPSPPSQSYTAFTEPQGPVAVNLSGLPPALCRRNFLEAMLDQAGLADEIMGCVLGEEQETGTAVIYLANFSAALRCVQHFGGRSWAGAPVVAEVAKGQSPPAVAKPTAGIPTDNNPNDVTNHQASPALGYATGPGVWALPQAMLPLMAVQTYNKGSDFSPMNAGNNSPKSTGSGSDSPKTRWADLEDEEKDLSEGLEGSTSADSTGRTRDDSSFSFGCDVDTDDGF